MGAAAHLFTLSPASCGHMTSLNDCAQEKATLNQSLADLYISGLSAVTLLTSYSVKSRRWLVRCFTFYNLWPTLLSLPFLFHLNLCISVPTPDVVLQENVTTRSSDADHMSSIFASQFGFSCWGTSESTVITHICGFNITAHHRFTKTAGRLRVCGREIPHTSPHQMLRVGIATGPKIRFNTMIWSLYLSNDMILSGCWVMLSLAALKTPIYCTFSPISTVKVEKRKTKTQLNVNIRLLISLHEPFLQPNDTNTVSHFHERTKLIS